MSTDYKKLSEKLKKIAQLCSLFFCGFTIIRLGLSSFNHLHVVTWLGFFVYMPMMIVMLLLEQELTHTVRLEWRFEFTLVLLVNLAVQNVSSGLESGSEESTFFIGSMLFMLIIFFVDFLLRIKRDCLIAKQ